MLSALGSTSELSGHKVEHEPLRIIVHLVEIALGELQNRPCTVSATASKKRFTLTLRHEGKPIDERMVWLMDDQIDRAKYQPDGDSWVLTLRRDIPSFYIDHDDLIRNQCNAAHDEQHCTGVLRDFETIFTFHSS